MYVEGKPGVFECIHVRLQITFSPSKNDLEIFFLKICRFICTSQIKAIYLHLKNPFALLQVFFIV